MNPFANLPRYRVLYNVAGRGHDRYGDIISARNITEAFAFAVQLMNRLNPDLDVDAFHAFYVGPADLKGDLLYHTSSKFHGWDGVRSYPIK